MRAHTKGKQKMGKRFAILIGVAAVGVMALGAQTALAGGESVDSTPPDLQLSGPKKQSPQNVPRDCPRPRHRGATRATTTGMAATWRSG